MASVATASSNMNDTDVHIRYEDQSKINRFAIHNTRMHEYQDDLVEKKKQLQNLNEAIDELVLFDGDDVVPFQHGEVFTHLSADEANVELERAKQELEDEIKALDGKVAAIKKLLAELKVQLYARFGNKINLEENEDE